MVSRRPRAWLKQGWRTHFPVGYIECCSWLQPSSTPTSRTNLSKYDDEPSDPRSLDTWWWTVCLRRNLQLWDLCLNLSKLWPSHHQKKTSPRGRCHACAMQRTMPMRLLLESTIRQPEGRSVLKNFCGWCWWPTAIIRFRQFDGVNAVLLETAVIDVEDIESVAPVNCVSPVSSSEVMRKFSSTTMRPLARRPDPPWRPPSSAAHRRPSCPRRLLCETLQGTRASQTKLARLARRPYASSAELHPTNPHRYHCPLQERLWGVPSVHLFSQRSPPLCQHKWPGTNWSRSTSL